MSSSRIRLNPYYLRHGSRVLVCVCGAMLLALASRWRGVLPPSQWTLLPPATERRLAHLRRSRQIADYVNDTWLISPQSDYYCSSHNDVAVVALVSSAPGSAELRAAIRNTWGSRLPTFFFMGRTGNGDMSHDDDLISNYIEAKQHGDMIVGDYIDSYENLTLKTCHMMAWAAAKCPSARFVLKTDDDVLVNPWTLRRLVEETGGQLVGYKLNNSVPHRDVESKWYLPKWLYRSDVIPEYLSGTGYLVNGEYLYKIIEASKEVPIINLEDVYLTYLVAKQHLKLTLTHDNRLSPYQPIVSSGCAFFKMASVHSLTARQMLNVWPKITSVIDKYKNGEDPCYSFDKMFGFLSMDQFLI